MSKYKCPNCKRAVDISKEYCPFCSTPNPNKSTPEENDDFFDNSKVDDFFDAEVNVQNSSYEVTDIDEMNAIEKDNNLSELDDEQLQDELDGFSEDDFSETDNSTITRNNKRAKIPWSDEIRPDESHYGDMFDANGIYNANYDGFYNDTLPKITNEVDNLLKSKEKAILKVVASIVAIFAIIIYLVLTL